MIDLLPNETFPLMWLIFAVVFVVLNRLVFAPTLKIISARKEATDGLKEQALALLEGNQRQMAGYDEAINIARSKAAQEKEKIIQQARVEERSLIAKARETIEGELKVFKEKIEQEKKGVISQLNEQALELARDMVNKVLERKVA